METKRTMTVDTEMFEVGDVLAFALNDGEKVQATAVEETPAGMLFVLVDCLDKEYHSQGYENRHRRWKRIRHPAYMVLRNYRGGRAAEQGCSLCEENQLPSV